MKDRRLKEKEKEEKKGKEKKKKYGGPKKGDMGSKKKIICSKDFGKLFELGLGAFKIDGGIYTPVFFF